VTCPTCSAAGQRSTVRITTSATKAALADKLPTDHFWDEDGVEHHHNPNIIRTDYMCSNGHRFYERSSWECGCGYKACGAEVVA
jgi:hypothetical protein